MDETKAPTPLKLGDRVKLRHYSKRGRIVELRGPLGPGGKLAYRVIVSRKPRPVYIDVTEDQVVLIPAASPFAGRAEAKREAKRGRKRGRESK
jgi:hypothetical protein